MIVNADKFQSIINSDTCNQYTLNINGNQGTSEKFEIIFRRTRFLTMYKKQVISLTQ